MKLLSKHLKKDGTGSFLLTPEIDEDLWHLYNLIVVNDVIKASAVRRVLPPSGSNRPDSRRVHTILSVRVTKLYFASGSFEEGGASSSVQTAQLHVSGTVVGENEFVKSGQYHTIDIACGTKFEISRDRMENGQGNVWDTIDLDRIEEACTEGKDAEIAAILVGESSALICLLTGHMTIIRQRIEASTTKKLGSAAERAQERFFSTILQAVEHHLTPMLWASSLKSVIIAGPGFTRENLYDYIFAEAAKNTGKYSVLHRSKHIFLKVHTSTAHVHALKEAIKDPKISSQLSNNKYAREEQCLERFRKLMDKDPLRAWYGPDEVAIANGRGAIGTLLLLDTLFRSTDVQTRQKYATLIEEVRQNQGEVVIFSSLNGSGKELKYLTGIAAILTFPLDIESIQEESTNQSEAAPA